MARRSSRAPLLIGGAAAFAIAGAAGWMLLSAERPAAQDPAAASETPTLPAGRLQLLRPGVTEARYLALDAVRRTQGGASVLLLVVARDPAGLQDGTAFMTKRSLVDCAGGRIFEGRAGYFDADGRLKTATSFYAAKRGRPIETSDYEATAVCEGARGRIVPGWRVAQRESQSLPKGFEATATARPQDAVAWARLCAAGARGRWRSETPADCDRAVQLNPDDVWVRLDRGFMRLGTGKTAAADADFRGVMATQPQNPAAIYGHSLVLAISGDEAASRVQRGRALDLDPSVPDWVEASYRIMISPGYRTR